MIMMRWYDDDDDDDDDDDGKKETNFSPINQIPFIFTIC